MVMVTVCLECSAVSIKSSFRVMSGFVGLSLGTGLVEQTIDWGKVQVSEHPLSQIATAHISFFRAYFGLYTSTILGPA